MTRDALLQMLCEACDRPLEWETELLESGYLDSLALVLLEERWEEAGLELSVARLPRQVFATPRALWEWLLANGKAMPEC